MGTKTHSLLRDLLAPSELTSKTVVELFDALQKHIEPAIIIAERFKFHKRTQSQNESVAQFVADLKRLTSTCDFKNNLDDSLRDRFVCGLQSTATQKKLLGIKDLTFQKAVETAISCEVVEKHIENMKSSSVELVEVHKTTVKVRQCHRCGKAGQEPDVCRFKNSRCFNCQRMGHVAAVCRAESRARNSNTRGRGRRIQVHKQVIKEEDDSDSEELEECGLYHVYKVKSRAPPITVTMEVNNKKLSMEVDTGAAVSIMSEETKRQLFPSLQIKKSGIILQMYTSDQLSTLGKCLVTAKYQNQKKNMEIYVVKGKGPTLLGRDWLQHFKLDWARITQVSIAQNLKVERLCDQYKEVFSERVGEMKYHKAKLQLKESARPKYYRARPVPFAIKEEVARELDQLEAEGGWSQVNGQHQL